MYLILLPFCLVGVGVVSFVVSFVLLLVFYPLKHFYLAIETVRVGDLETELFVFNDLVVDAETFGVHEAKFIFFERCFNVLTEIVPGLHNYLVVFNDFPFIFPNQN